MKEVFSGENRFDEFAKWQKKNPGLRVTQYEANAGSLTVFYITEDEEEADDTKVHQCQEVNRSVTERLV